MLSSWAQNDPSGASEWLATFPAGKDQDQAVQNFVNQTSWQFPEIAASWVGKIKEEQQRNFAIENVARQWLEFDTSAAQNWLAQTSLPEERKAMLLKNR